MHLPAGIHAGSPEHAFATPVSTCGTVGSETRLSRVTVGQISRPGWSMRIEFPSAHYAHFAVRWSSGFLSGLMLLDALSTRRAAMST